MLILIFSKDRCMQLDLLLRTMPPTDGHRIVILYRETSGNNYITLQNLHRHTRTIEWRAEKDFFTDFKHIITTSNDECILFLVDDTIFYGKREVDFYQIPRLMEYYSESAPPIVGFSLRLGTNTDWCYMTEHLQRASYTYHGNTKTITWPLAWATHDYAYEWDLSSSVYFMKDLRKQLDNIGGVFRNPNELEMMLNSIPPDDQSKKWIAFNESVAYSNPLNVTQELWRNKCANIDAYTIENLRRMWEQGYRFAIPKPHHITSAHQCILLPFEKRR